MEAIAISGMIGFCLGYIVCGLLISGSGEDGEE